LHLLHPIMPFITEELYEKFIGGKGLLIRDAWPQLPASLIDAKAQGEIGWVVRLISDIRAVRSEMNVPAGAVLPLVVREANAETQARLEHYGNLVKRLARIGDIDAGNGAMPNGSVQIVLDEATFALPLADIIDFAAERARLKKEIGKLDGEIGKIDGKLNNAAFVAKAPPEVVDEQRERREDAVATKQRLGRALQQIAG
jgi:valyl-tRNA synthetase